MAKEINAPYYETSVFTGYGIKEMFENVIRSALISRRHQRFWMTNLKHVRNCLIQEPFCPPKPPFPQLKVPCSQYQKDIRSLLSKQAYTDVVFVNNSSSIHCHKIVLVAASDIFHSLFTYHHYNQKTHFFNYTNTAAITGEKPLSKCASDVSITGSIEDFDRQKHKLFNDDSLLDVQTSRHFMNFFSASLLFPLLNFDKSRLFKHPFSKHNRLLFCSKLNSSKLRFKLLQQKLITVYKNVKNFRSDKSKCHSVISFGKNIPFDALRSYVFLIYSLNWKYTEYDPISVSNLPKCLRFLDFVDFDSALEELSSGSLDCFMNRLKKYIDEMKSDIFIKRFAFFAIEKGLFSGKFY